MLGFKNARLGAVLVLKKHANETRLTPAGSVEAIPKLRLPLG